jgi:tetratricopeptide (TPR) repeat protein
VEEIFKGLKYGEGEMSEAELVKYHYIVARALYQMGKYQEAASHFVECVRGKDKFPAYADALDYAADSFVRMGEQNVVADAKKTVENLLRAIELDPQKAQAWFLLGRMYKDLGETTKAIEAFTRVVKLQPSYPYAYHALAGALRDKQNLDEALNAINEELKQRPDNYDALVERAEIQIELKNFDQAKQDLNNAMRRDPTRWQAYMVRANLAYVQEDYDTARQNIEQVLRLKPDAVEAHLIMGKILTAKKDIEAARQWFSNVIEYLEQQPNLTYKFKTVIAEAYTRMAEIDLTEDSPRQAEARLRRALEFVPDYAPALAKIGDVKKRLANDLDTAAAKKRFYREAEEYYRRAIEANPRDPDLYLALGILYHKNLKDTRKAVVNYQKYLELGGKDRATVSKWIEESGGMPEGGSEETTATVLSTSSVTAERNHSTADSKSQQ